jgi:hypothetical protein
MVYAAAGLVLVILVAILCAPFFRIAAILLDEGDD